MPDQESKTFIGVSTARIGSITAKELLNNEVAITMLIQYYGELEGKNEALRQVNAGLQTNIEALERYQKELETKQENVLYGAILQFLAVVFIGFGTNLLTNGHSYGWLLFVPGIASELAGVYFSVRRK